MDVDIYFARVKLQKEDCLRIVPAGQPPLVGLAHGGQQAFVTDGTVIDVKKDAVGTRLADIGQGRQPVYTDAVACIVHRT